METIKVKIIENGKARELNPVPKVFATVFINQYEAESQRRIHNKSWQEAESRLRTFDIVKCGKRCQCYTKFWKYEKLCRRKDSVFTAEVISQQTIRIIE